MLTFFAFPRFFVIRAFFQFIAISRWLAFRLDAMMFVLLALCSFLAVIVKETGKI